MEAVAWEEPGMRRSTLLQPSVRRVFRAIWILLSILTLSILPWMIIEFKKAAYSVHYQAWVIAGIFVILAVSASIYEVAMHLEHYNRPRLQIRVVRILCMVPIYAIDAWLSLRFKGARFYIDPLRECYEAFVIYNFFMYLVTYLEDEYGDVAAYFSVKEQVPHLWPADKFLSVWRMGEQFFWETKRGVLSYVIARPLMTAVSMITQAAGVYCEGEFRRHCAYPYVAFVNNMTQFWALYCLVLLYQATHTELAPIRPLSKFVVIKAVVFFSYWQSVFIDICAELGLLRPAEWSTYDSDDIAAGLQNFLICIEMFVAAVAHAHAFPPRDYMDPNRPPAGFLNNVRVMFDVRDVVQDVHGVVSDTIDETTTNIRDAGRRTWTAVSSTAREAAAVPQKLVQKPLNLLLGREAKRKGGVDGGGDEHDSDNEADGDPLLPTGAAPGSREGGGSSGDGGGSGGGNFGSRGSRSGSRSASA